LHDLGLGRRLLLEAAQVHASFVFAGQAESLHGLKISDLTH
jgi:hypothetical protein